MGKCGPEKKQGDECALGVCASGKQTVYNCAEDKTCTRSDKTQNCAMADLAASSGESFVKDVTAEFSAKDGLSVDAMVYVSSSAMSARLEKKAAQGFNKKILLLEAKQEAHSSGGLQAFQWVPASYSEAAAKGQYTRVSIIFARKIVATIDVKDAD